MGLGLFWFGESNYSILAKYCLGIWLVEFVSGLNSTSIEETVKKHGVFTSPQLVGN